MDERSGLILDVTPSDATPDREFLERLGHPVLVCHGPSSTHACPIIAGSNCQMVDDAHGVIFQLDLDRPQHRDILSRYQEAIPDDVPIVAVIEPGQDERYANLLAGVQVWIGEPSIARLDGFAAETETADEFRDSTV